MALTVVSGVNSDNSTIAFIKRWPLKRRIISNRATTIARHGLKIKDGDLLSGFFGLTRDVIQAIQIDSEGYKILSEILLLRISSSSTVLSILIIKSPKLLLRQVSVVIRHIIAS